MQMSGFSKLEMSGFRHPVGPGGRQGWNWSGSLCGAGITYPDFRLRTSCRARSATASPYSPGKRIPLPTPKATTMSGAIPGCQDAPPPAPDTDQNPILELATLCEKSKGWIRAKNNATRLEKARGFASQILKAYQERQTAYVSQILQQISVRVADIYEKLHPSGEGLTGVAVEPWTAKGIELAIDFHGTRQRPPHGGSGEAHVDSP